MKTLQINNIVVPTDFSPTGSLAVQHAAFMAKLCKADLYLFHSVDIPAAIYMVYVPTLVLPDFTEIDAIAEKKLDELAASLRKEYGITIKTICSRGKAAAEIVTAVKDYNIDLVIMGTHGISGFDEYLVGSNAQRVVTLCPCPVITVQGHAKKLGFTNIVLPIDNDFYSRQKVEPALELAKKYSAKIHILGLPPKGEDVNLNTFQIKLDSVEKLVKNAGLPYECQLIRTDNTARTAMNYAKKVDADLLVVLNDHESELNEIFLGTFAQQIVNHSRIPVMSIRTEEVLKYDSVSLSSANPF
jgi:nucleotide-binding universal stress UspA family protein